MAGRIRDEDIAEVRAKSNIEDVIGEHVQLRNAGGGNLKGICPFHDEKSPSLSVSAARGLFHCFGCGAGGDVIRFVERIEHLSFSEAVERLAAAAGIQLRYAEGGTAGPRVAGQRARLIEAHTLAAAFYVDQLASADARPARDFLRERGFDGEAASRFGCGYAPSGWDALSKYLMGRGFGRDELILAGLSKDSARGTLNDRFHRRLLWPIKDVSGDVVGFGARRIHDDDKIEAKYLNTPETPIYKKSQLLYGMDAAKREIAKQRKVVVVEGYTDVMACQLAGVTTAVATCGTAFGTEHIGVIRRLLMDSDTFNGKVIFTFDGDAAGMKAAERAYSDEQRFMAQTYVAIEAGGKDPCELRQSGGDQAVRLLVDSAIPLVEFVLRTTVARHDLETVEGRSAAIDGAIPMIAAIKDRSRHDGFASKLAGLVGLDDPNPIVQRVRSYDRAVGRSGSASGSSSGTSAAASSSSTARPAPNRPPGPERSAPDRPDSGASPRTGDYRDPAANLPPAPPLASPVPPKLVALEREVLKAALQLPGDVGKEFDELGVDAFLMAVHRQLSEAVARAGGATGATAGPAWVDAVSAHLPPESEARGAVNGLAVEPLFERPDRQGRYASAMVTSLSEKVLAREIASVKARIQRLTAVDDHEGATAQFAQLFELERRHRELRDLAIGGEA
ncbi:MAG: primase [Frankiales bacterium]|nr:primase [Frankiales bacterium]